jgi:hypothetical protein
MGDERVRERLAHRSFFRCLGGPACRDQRAEADACGGEACGWLVRAPAGGCGRSPTGLIIGLALICTKVRYGCLFNFCNIWESAEASLVGWMVDDPVGGGHDEVAQKAVASSSLLSSTLCRDCVETDIGFRRNSDGSSRRENDMEDEKCSVLTKWFCTGLVQIGQCLLRYDRHCVHFKYSHLYLRRKRRVWTCLVL